MSLNDKSKKERKQITLDTRIMEFKIRMRTLVYDFAELGGPTPDRIVFARLLEDMAQELIDGVVR